MSQLLEQWISGAGGGGLTLAAVAALLLGLRHATDADHLAAVATLVVDEAGRGDAGGGAGRAGTIGLSWGIGHALTLFALGLPVVLVGGDLPEGARRGAEAAVGLVIVILAARLLYRWRRGHFHAHRHRHGDLEHAHPHLHEGAARGRPAAHAHPGAHDHRHAEALGRSPLAAFGVGLLHGIGGSAVAGVLLAATASDAGGAALLLAVYALGTAISMAGLSYLVAGALLHGSLRERLLPPAIPVLGALSLAFGVWYALAAFQAS